MLGLVVIAILTAYLAVSGLVIWLAMRWARKHKRRPWVWGGVAAFAMYNLVFWDLIPTLAMHKYYCATEAGFWVYKTPEQWVKENPGVMETLTNFQPQKTERLADGRVGYWFNERIRYEVSQPEVAHAIGRYEQLLRDMDTQVILVRKIDFSLGRGSASFVSGGTLEGWRRALVFGWFDDSRQCSVPSDDSPDEPFGKMLADFYKIGEGK
jgi:hypothetical protein